ncbi:plasmid replication protein RepC [Methylocapsa palsarum]|uniref:Replication initiation protein RepC n=1 Tax=Methylocapsa palsarum TaxID=1612308 RepID=A0A1I4B629_9HYPH|nr:plasmid replication protein RepC [Methylocapsa palsarum]SFK63993.1 replication initiation protein RepC [Methylocapsa palsarum]
MQTAQSTTPYGRRPYSLALLANQIAAKSSSSQTIVDKWRVLDDIRKANAALGVSDRTLSVLNALLSFHQDTILNGGEAIIVFPSNKNLAQRANGMADNTLRRHLAALVELGLILRRDSPNGKRYARKGEGGEIEEAFGFDLSPLVARAAEFKGLAAEARAREQLLRSLRDRITISRRDIDKMIATGLYEEVGADWNAFSKSFAGLNGRIPRKAPAEVLGPLAGALEHVADQIRAILEDHLQTTKISANGAHDERHIQNSKPNSISESEMSLPEKKEAGIEPNVAPKTPLELEATQQPPKRSFPLPMVLEACPDIAEHAPNGIRSWRELMTAATLVRPWLGISPSAWEEANAVLGPEDAAVIVAAILQRSSSINSPGGYLRNLTEKARAGAFSLGPVLMALINAKMRASTQKRA